MVDSPCGLRGWLAALAVVGILTATGAACGEESSEPEPNPELVARCKAMYTALYLWGSEAASPESEELGEALFGESRAESAAQAIRDCDDDPIEHLGSFCTRTMRDLFPSDEMYQTIWETICIPEG